MTARRVKTIAEPRYGIAESLSEVPREPHYYIILDETYSEYDHYDSSITRIKLEYRWFLDESTWKEAIAATTSSMKAFLAGKSIPAKVDVKVDITFGA